MTAFDGLWYLTDEADRAAERARHRLRDRYDDDHLERTYRKRISRGRFRTLAERIRENGAPYGAHTVVSRPSGELLLVRHEDVDMWVLPGGDLEGSETFREAARRELREEAGVEARYDGLAMVVRVEVVHGDHETWGVMPVFGARASATATPAATDPDGEITAARWFPLEAVPEDTRDREDVIAAARASR
ncbi:NUDIX hydrolase [Halobacteriales archaeon QS_4_69_225]|nr:MAG: NUDIX hydrolase [Halobacteriales archaeon QS_4_69_225]